MNKTEEKKMIIRACEKTVELSRSYADEGSEWCTEGMIEYLQDIFPAEHADLITETINKAAIFRYEITLTFNSKDVLDIDFENRFRDYSATLRAIDYFGYEDVTDADFSIKAVDNA